MKTIEKPGKTYTVTDGNMVLTLESDGGKWLVVTCPFDPELVTQARSIDEAFAMAYDAKRLLDECRAEDIEARRRLNGESADISNKRMPNRRRTLAKARS